MESLFGIPIDQVAAALVGVFFLGVVVIAVIALRNRVVFKMAVRNIPRRRAQSTLIVVGLMLATLLFSASFTIGDTLAHSIRVEVLAVSGHVDEAVRSDLRDDSGRRDLFDDAVFDEIVDALADAPVDGVLPLITWSVPAVYSATNRSEPTLTVLGLDGSAMDGFDPLVELETGRELPIADLSAGEVYLSVESAESLRAEKGDEISLFFGAVPTNMRIAGVYDSTGNEAPGTAAVLPLDVLQGLLGAEGQVNRVYISNDGGLVSGAEHSEVVFTLLEEHFEGTGFDVQDTKREGLEIADLVGTAFTSLFLLFGNFSIMAGILLIFLIFVMLAAERKRELGISRAVGAQRNHIVRMFVFEGALYSVMAAAVGSLLGVGVAYVMVKVLAFLFESFEIDIIFAFSFQSIIISYTLGMAVTFIVVVVSAWRVSVLNIVRAVRDIPEPPTKPVLLRERFGQILSTYARGGRQVVGLRPHRALKAFTLSALSAWIKFAIGAFAAGYLAVIIGAALAFMGATGESLGPFMLGVSFVFIGVALAFRHAFGLSERKSYSFAGTLVVVLWIVPWNFTAIGLPDFQGGIEMFILSGVMLVIGSVWVTMYNAPPVVRVLTSLMGRGKTLAPIMRTSLAYPMNSRFRTGMTLAMFSLIVFTLMVLSTIITSFGSLTDDSRKFSGGFDISARVSLANPVGDLAAELANVQGVSPAEIAAIGGQSGLPVKLQQVGFMADEAANGTVISADAGFTSTVEFGFSMRDARYESDGAVWQALENEPGTAVVWPFLVPGRGDFSLGEDPDAFRLQGFFRDDEVLPEVTIEVYDRAEQKMITLRVIGVMDDSVFPEIVGPIVTSRETLAELQNVPLMGYQIRLNDPTRAAAIAEALEDHFVANGFEAESLEETMREQFAINLGFNRLIRGFMSLGLVVGVAALGVISARSVVERRVLIGMLRAIGYQRSMVQASFLIESSFIALVGIVLGMALGLGLSVGIIREISQDIDGLEYRIPWSAGALVVAVAYGASLLTTFLPARQAASIYPAEALRMGE